MKREQLIETINQTALNVWRDSGMMLQAYEECRGHWVIQLNSVRQHVRTEHLVYVMNAMVATALNYKPKRIKSDDEVQALQYALHEAGLYENMGMQCPDDTPAQKAYERMRKQRETA